MMQLARSTALFATLAIAILATNAAHGAGWYNMPTNLRQCMGMGFGPGYHAPLVLVQPCRSHVAAQGIQYTRHPLQPASCQHGYCGQMTTLAPQAPMPHVEASYAGAMPYAGATMPMVAPHPVAYPTPTPVTRPPAVAPTLAPQQAPQMPTQPVSPSDMIVPEQLPLPRG